MRYLALACDYDGTVAMNGLVNVPTLAALRRVLESGRKLMLVTGRELDDLLDVFPHANIFERIVAENGALLYRPADKETRVLADPPPQAFVLRLQERGVEPISIGRVIVSTREPHEATVLDEIRNLGLELQVIFNKGAVMVLPAGVNKATGLRLALREMGLSAHNLVGVGDAENDHAFLSVCHCAVAVSNALPMVQKRADLVTAESYGEGVSELIEHMLHNDLDDLNGRLVRHHIRLGTDDSGEEVRIDPLGSNILIAGLSGSGKSTIATGLLERLSESSYQFCIIDPEGDYEGFEGAVVLGDRQRVPGKEEMSQLLENPASNSVINLLGVSLSDRPAFFAGLLPRLQDLRTRTGRPHWTVVDETHHLLPPSWNATAADLQKLEGMVFITVHPDQVSPAVLASIDIMIVVGESPQQSLDRFAESIGEPRPSAASISLESGEAVVWFRRKGSAPFRVRFEPPRSDHRRHRRKYAEGELGPDKSFYFQGPTGALNLRAQNLAMFMQLAEGVDDKTWNYHLEKGDYSSWFRDAIKDEDLFREIARIERRSNLPAAETRAMIKTAIERHYTLPTEAATAKPK
jgi:HAD superfamily hydrolase (TIGR01484 family)